MKPEGLYDEYRTSLEVKIEIRLKRGNDKRKTIKNSNICGLNNMLLNNQQITKEIKICIETKENENTTIQNLWDTVKAMLRGRFTAIQAYFKKQEKKSNK